MSTINGSVEIELDSESLSSLAEQVIENIDYDELASEVEDRLNYDSIAQNVELDITDAVENLLHRYKPERNDQCSTIREANNAVERGMIYTVQNSEDFQDALTPVVLAIIEKNAEKMNTSINETDSLSGEIKLNPIFTYGDMKDILQMLAIRINATQNQYPGVNINYTYDSLFSFLPSEAKTKMLDESKNHAD